MSQKDGILQHTKHINSVTKTIWLTFTEKLTNCEIHEKHINRFYVQNAKFI